MAKAKYNPLEVFKQDPLAALKIATDQAAPKPVLGDALASEGEQGRDVPDGDREQFMAASQGSVVRAGLTKSSALVKPLSSSLQTSRNTVYLYPEDLTKLRQLSGYASTEHGIRANDSMIVRAALSLLEPDVRLLHALKETELLDRRRRGRQ